jgi:outer membrane cobalamin receptor
MITRLYYSILFLTLTGSGVSFAQQADSTFSRFPRDTTIVLDSLVIVRPIPLAGALEPRRDSSRSVTATDITWNDYRYIGDLLERQPGVFVRDMGSPGQNNQLTIGGADSRSIAFLSDGRPINDPISGTYDMMLYPVDNIQRIEFITGPRAMVYGLNSTGGAVNIVTKEFYTNKPYSRLRYSQGIDDYGQTDALFSQNIFRGFNFTFGLARFTIGSNNQAYNFGGHYPNAENDAWSFRTTLRYARPNTINLVFSHVYHQTMTGLNGGVDFQQTPPGNVFIESGARVTNYDAYEKVYIHQLDLTALAYHGDDSTRITSLSAYYSSNQRLYRDEENRSINNGVLKFTDLESSTRGALLKHTWETPVQHLLATLQAEQVQVTSGVTIGMITLNRYSGSLKEELVLVDGLTAAVFGRADYYRSSWLPGAGADASLMIVNGLTLFAGASYSYRTPTLQELYWTGDSIQHPTYRAWLKNEQHTVAEAGIRFSLFRTISGSISVQHREIAHPILIDTLIPVGRTQLTYLLQISQGASKTYDCITAAARGSIGPFIAEGNATYLSQPTVTRDNVTLKLFPSLTLDGSVYFRGLLANGNLDLKIGVRGRYYSSQTGMGPLPESWFYVPGTLLSYGPSGTMDFFVIAHLGDAYLHLIWENVTSNQYLLTPVYPMYGSNLRFGVSWEFLD